MKFETTLIHGRQQPDPSTGAIMPPIYQTSTYVQAAPGDHKGYEYSRTKNPTRTALEDSLAAIEGGAAGLAFGSGMAATDTVLRSLTPGDHVVAGHDLYGGTYRLFETVYRKYGIEVDYAPLATAAELAGLMKPNTKLVWIETPTNPLLHVVDIKAMAEVAHQHGALLAVDNTFATPMLQQPLLLGADVVMHSATKYLSGHSDTVLGALVCRHHELADTLATIQNTCGPVAGPMDSFLVLRGIKTLHLRIERHSRNAAAVVAFLQSHPKVDKIYWPGLATHSTHAVAAKQMKDFGGMLSFTLKEDTVAAATKVLSATKVFSLAESLGGVESLIGHPASMTHASIPRETRLANGINDSLIRLSVGVEHEDDLIADLKQALG